MTATAAARATRTKGSAQGKGLVIERVFTKQGVHPYDEVEWDRRDVVQTNWRTGETVFEQRGVEFPSSWSVNASTIVTTKYFRGALGSPQRERAMRAAGYFLRLMGATRRGAPIDADVMRDESLACRRWLEDELHEPAQGRWGDTVVVTHFAPSLRCAGVDTPEAVGLQAQRSSALWAAGGIQRCAGAATSGSKQASTTCRSLSRAKFITKSQAMGSWPCNARLTTTHLTPLITFGIHQGE